MTFITATQLLEFAKGRALASVRVLDVNGRHVEVSGRKGVRVRVEFTDGEVRHVTYREWDKSELNASLSGDPTERGSERGPARL